MQMMVSDEVDDPIAININTSDDIGVPGSTRINSAPTENPSVREASV